MTPKTNRDTDTEDPEVEEQEALDEASTESAESTDEPTDEERIAALEQECEELRLKWSRAQADYQNLKRRGQSDFELGAKRRMQPLLEELLFVLDYLDMALAAPLEAPEAKNLAVGVEMTRSKLTQALETEGVEPIAIDGPFDPALHEASQTVQRDDLVEGTIVEVVRKGYTWGETVLRYAQVVVSTTETKDEQAED